MSNEFFSLLYERIDKNKMTGRRLEDAVNNVIDTFQYKELNVADVISYDKRVKLHTYTQVCDEVCSGRATMEDFQIQEVDGRRFWVRKVDILNLKFR